LYPSRSPTQINRKEDLLQCLILFVPTSKISPLCLYRLSVWPDEKSGTTIAIIADFEAFEKTAKALLKALPKKT
jgi:hypothetical protein